MKDEAFLDAFASQAMNDMFGDNPEGKQLKETFEQTGQLVPPGQERMLPTRNVIDVGYTVVQPMDYKKIAAAVSEEKLCEALSTHSDYNPIKEKAITQVANECASEAEAQLKKILKALR